MLKRFAKDNRGSAQMWVAFCILMFFMLAAVLYNAHALYSKYWRKRRRNCMFRILL